MDIKAFLVNRGEWLLTAVVLLICVFAVWSVYADVDGRPKADAEAIKAEFDKIHAEVQRTNVSPPQPESRRPADSLAALQRRLAVNFSAPQLSQWLTKHPDVYAALPPDSEFLYAYSILTPLVEAQHDIGTFELTVQLPEALPSSDERYVAGAEASWMRELPGQAAVKNHVRVFALQVQAAETKIGRTGAADWQPLEALGDGGLVLLTASDLSRGRVSLDVGRVRAMHDYLFRARLLVAATGRKAGVSMGNDTVVYAGAMQKSPVQWMSFPRDYETYGTQAEQLTGDFALKERELLYAGSWSESIRVSVESDLRMGLRSVSAFGDSPTARVWLRKLRRDPSGQESLGWTPLEEFKVGKGERLGGTIKIKAEDGRFIEVDLTTDLTLLRVEKGLERELYYEIDLGLDEKGEKVLQVKPKTKKTDVAVFENKSANKEVRLIKLEHVRARANMVTYPAWAAEGQHEKDMLDAVDPSAFLAPADLRLEEPIWHEADDGLLLEHDPLAQNDRKYIELPDGRLVYYDHVNKKVFVVDMTPEQELPPGDEGAEPVTEPAGE